MPVLEPLKFNAVTRCRLIIRCEVKRPQEMVQWQAIWMIMNNQRMEDIRDAQYDPP
jgi:hypothetical protein